MAKFGVDKKAVLTLASAGIAMVSFAVNVLQKKSETNEIADKAAKIVMDKMSKDN